MNIYIPSKGRPNCKTYSMLKECHYDGAIVVVEPQDKDKYKSAGITNLLVLEKNDKGIGFARQSILQHARKSKEEWFWMLDDDITGMFVWNGQKLVKYGALAVLTLALQEAQKMPNLAVAGLDFRQFAWSHKGKPIKNTQVCAAVLINTKRTSLLSYPNHLMEDRDFCIQAILSGYETVRFTKYAFNTPPMGKEEGGCQMMSNRPKEMKRAVKALCRKYGEENISPYKKQNGWYDCRIKWKKLLHHK